MGDSRLLYRSSQPYIYGGSTKYKLVLNEPGLPLVGHIIFTWMGETVNLINSVHFPAPPLQLGVDCISSPGLYCSGVLAEMLSACIGGGSAADAD
jgi:hypothetical protein